MKLRYAEPVSSFAFNFNLRHYIEDITPPQRVHDNPEGERDVALYGWLHGCNLKAGAYTRPLHSSTLAVSDTKYTLNTP